MSKAKISAVINTRNEEKNLEDCLKTLGFCDEIIVVDMESTDDTLDIAKKYTHKVFNHQMVGFVEPARNFAISKAVGDWILIVDADERVPRSLAVKLLEISEDKNIDFVRLPRKNLVFGQWLQHSRWWPDYNVRFFRKGTVEWQDEIHSVPITTGNGLNMEAVENLALEHHHYENLDEFILRALRYSKQQARELIDSGYKFEVKDLIVKPIGEFISRFFAGEGYRDGLHGLALATLQFFAIFLIYLRVWEQSGYKPVGESGIFKTWTTSFVEKIKELQYWFLTVNIQHTTSKSKSMVLKIRRKLLRL